MSGFEDRHMMRFLAANPDHELKVWCKGSDYFAAAVHKGECIAAGRGYRLDYALWDLSEDLITLSRRDPA